MNSIFYQVTNGICCLAVINKQIATLGKKKISMKKYWGSIDMNYWCVGLSCVLVGVFLNHRLVVAETSSGDALIVNGQLVGDGEAKYQIALFDGGVFVCGGSLLANRTVLTAAHCVYG